MKFRRIRDITKSGLDVIHIIHRHALDSTTAFHVEASLIDAIPGTSNKVGGHYSNDIGPMNAFEIMTRYRAETAEFKHKIVLININRTAIDMNIYDAVRFSWKVDVERAKKADLVLALEKGIIVGVFKPIEWQTATEQNFPGFEPYSLKRYGFVGKDAPQDIQNEYLRKRIPNEFRKKGAANPIKYTF